MDSNNPTPLLPPPPPPIGTWRLITKRIPGFDEQSTRTIADILTRWFGSAVVIILHAIFFAGWIVWNSEAFDLVAFDPWPFHLLALIAGLEAIFLTSVVLMSQNRQQAAADSRQKIDLEINVRSEQEITKILNLLDKLQRALGIEGAADPELESMKQKTDIVALHKVVNKDEKK